MTDVTNSADEGTNPVDGALDPTEEARLRKLLRGALDTGTDESPDVLRGVQRNCVYVAVGSSTPMAGRRPATRPISTYFVTSLMMLTFIVFIYFVIHPLAGPPSTVQSVPVPVEVVPHR